jgi:pimeloyl-ACP methyl ester carboxylesterase
MMRVERQTMPPPFDLQTIEANGISLRAAVEGDGPLVIMVHGFPELWYSWRHQIKPIAQAGYRVVAPDMRGYGGSDKPYEVEAYEMTNMMADVIGIIDALGEDSAILVGHDWGAPIGWNTAALHADRVSAVAALSVPNRKRGEVSGIEMYRRIYHDNFFYQLYVQAEGVAESELEADVRTSLRKVYFSASGDAPSLDGWLRRAKGWTFLEAFTDPRPFPSWLTPEDLDYFVSNFETGGFRVPINRYRNQDRDFVNLPEMGAKPVVQPSCFIAGSKDLVRHFVPDYDLYRDVAVSCAELRFSRIIDGVGHWVQQEAPRQVNAALLEFLASLP